MTNLFLIFLGAGLGGVCRYGVANMVYWCIGRNFPYGTLMVNATGSFLMGFLFVFLIERVDGIAPELRSFLLVGFLGGYTTFSSFTIETLNLYENGAWMAAGLNIILSVVICMGLTWLGAMGARQ